MTDDCAPINVNAVTLQVGGLTLGGPGGLPFFFTDPVGPNAVFFEVQLQITGIPAGGAGSFAFFPLIPYQGTTANPSWTYTVGTQQPADIVMPSVNVTIPQCQSSVTTTFAISIFDDCDNPIVPARATFTLGGAALTPSFVTAAAGYFEFTVNATSALNGALLTARYQDAQRCGEIG